MAVDDEGGHKDYEDALTFPVEIVGRDGVVRQYSFEDAVRMYQRRMSFAEMRFRDPWRVRSERAHCTSRVQQLRQSYFRRYGWGTPPGAVQPQHRHPQLAGEIAAFLIEAFPSTGRLACRFTEVSDGGTPRESVWYVQVSGQDSGFLLYIQSFSRTAEGPAQYAALLRQLNAGRHGGGEDAEAVLAQRQCLDCGLVLTGQVQQLNGLGKGSQGSQPREDTPWDGVLASVRAGDLSTAFLRCRWVLEDQPWSRDAYVVGAMLGVVLDRAGDAEDLAYVGSRYFPKDALLQYYLGLARLHQDRLPDAGQALDEAIRLDPALDAARGTAVVVAMQRGRLLQVMSMAMAGNEREDHAQTAHTRAEDASRVDLLLRTLRYGMLLGVAVLLAVASCVLAIPRLGLVAMMSLLVVCVLAFVGASVVRNRMSGHMDTVYNEDLNLALGRVLRRGAAGWVA